MLSVLLTVQLADAQTLVQECSEGPSLNRHTSAIPDIERRLATEVHSGKYEEVAAGMRVWGLNNNGNGISTITLILRKPADLPLPQTLKLD